MPEDLSQLPGLQNQGPVDLNSLPGIMETHVGSRDNPLLQGGGKIGAPVLDFLHHATGGLTDKEVAALQAAGIMGGGVKGEDFSGRYHGSLTNLRNNLNEYEGVHPTAAKGEKAAAVIAPMAIAGPEVVAKTMAQAAGRSGVAGAGMGAAYGFGGSNDESLSQDLTATGVGGVAGGAAGLALPVGLGIAKAPFRMAKNAASVFRKEGMEVAAGRVLNDADSGLGKFEPAPLPGMKLTTGQVTNDPGLLWLERSVRESSPHGAALSANALADNNGAIRTNIAQIGNSSTDASKAMSDALDAAYTRRQGQNRAAWKTAGVDEMTGIKTQPLKESITDWQNTLPKADRASVPADLLKPLGEFGQEENLGEIQALRSRVLAAARTASRAGDGNTARIIGGAADRITNFLDDLPNQTDGGMNVWQQANYAAARGDTAEMKKVFKEPPAIRKALGVDSYGADKVPESAMADHFIRTGKGAKEDFNSYLSAISSKDPTGKTIYDQNGLKAAQDAFTQKFLSQVSNSGMDANGQNLVSPAKMQKFLGDYSHVINSPAFTSDQRDLIGRIAKASQMASRVQNSRPPGGGSDTFQKLQGDKFIDALVGPGASKLIGAAGKLGGAAMGAIEEGKIGAMMGFVAGEKGGEMVNSLYKAPREKVINLITEAMHDPQLAKDLMMKASNTNAKLLPPPRRAKLFGVLGAQSAQPVVNAVTAPAQ
jgi:hypothetical protein